MENIKMGFNHNYLLNANFCCWVYIAIKNYIHLSVGHEHEQFLMACNVLKLT